MRALFNPETLQAGAVKGLKGLEEKSVCTQMDVGSIPCFGSQSNQSLFCFMSVDVKVSAVLFLQKSWFMDTVL